MSICNNQLLQVKLDNEYIQNWTPLECVDKNPRNCGASALALAKIIPTDLAQLISRDTEISGINEMKMLEIINKEYALETKYGLIYSDISNVQEIFNELEPGNGTVVLFIRPDGSGHIVILAKDANNIKYVLEAQYLQTYTESSISQYIASEFYNSFFIFCNTIAANNLFQSILGKRKLDNLDVVDTNTKKPRRNTPSNNNKMDLVTDNNDMMDVVTNDNDNTVTGSGKKSKKARTKSKKGKKGKNSRKNTKYKNIA